MRLAMPFFAAFAVLVAVTGCGGGGGDDAEPIAISQRVVAAEDAPGSKPDPVEKRQQTAEFEEFIDGLGHVAVDPDKEEMTTVFRKAGFEEAIIDARFFGETHSPDSPHIFSSVIQLESEEGAEAGLEWLDADSMKPCPRTCAVRISELDVDGIPEARGVRRSQSEEDIEAVGNEDDRPFDSYEVRFTDGPFVYSVVLSGPPGSVSEGQLVDIATAFYDRIKGAPPLAE